MDFSHIDHGFYSQLYEIPKVKKHSRSMFLVCPYNGTSNSKSITCNYNNTNSTKSQWNDLLWNERCFKGLCTRPPPSPNYNQGFRQSAYSQTIPNLLDQSSFYISSYNSSRLNTLRSSSIPLSFDMQNTSQKCISLQTLLSRRAEQSHECYPNKFENHKYKINENYYLTQRPEIPCSLYNVGDHIMNPQTLKSKSLFIRRSAKPLMDNQRRREYSLKFMIESITNVTSKKRFHCELKLNNRTYARTSSRIAEKGKATWNEIYELCNLSPVTSVTINLYKEMIEGKGDKKKNIRQKIAFVTMPIEELYERNEVKKKLFMQKCLDAPLNHSYATNFCMPIEQKNVNITDKLKRRYLSDSSDSDFIPGEFHSSSLPRDSCSGSTKAGLLRYLRSRKDGEIPAIFISAKYQCIEILPLNSYKELREFMLSNYKCLVPYLDDKLSGRRLEEVASSMVSIHELSGNAPKFITNSICSKLETRNNSNTVALRSNSIGSKSIESYMKLIGMEYLKYILEEFSLKVILYPSSLEVDPSRLNDKSFLKLTQVQLCSMVLSLCQKILSSSNLFPIELKKVFVTLRRSLELQHSPEFADQLLSSCLFLRLICPAILNPYLYQLIQEYPQDPRIIRNFTLISKSLQTLANQTGSENEGPPLKEPFMIPIHESLSKEKNKMISFLREISTDATLIRNVVQENSKCEEYIDLGFELAMSHLYLSDVLIPGPADQKLPPDLTRLIPILNDISTLLCSSPDQTSSKNTTEIIPKPNKILTDSPKENLAQNVTPLINKYNVSSLRIDPLSNPETKHIKDNIMRKGSINLELENNLDDKNDQSLVEDRHTLNATDINTMWKSLVEKAEEHIISIEQSSKIEFDLDSDLHMEYQFCFNQTEETSPISIDMISIPSSGQTPTSQNLTMDTSLNCDLQSSEGTSPIIYYPLPPPIDTLPINLVHQLSPTKSIKMGTKAVQTTKQKKPFNEIDLMRRMVSDAELKYMQAMKEIEDKEEENRLLRELIRSQTAQCQKNGLF